MEERYLIPTTLQVKEIAEDKVYLRVLQTVKSRNISVICLLTLFLYCGVKTDTHMNTFVHLFC